MSSICPITHQPPCVVKRNTGVVWWVSVVVCLFYYRQQQQTPRAKSFVISTHILDVLTGFRNGTLNAVKSILFIAVAICMPKWLSMSTDKRRDKQSYWEDRLTRCGLSVESGRHEWISYGHRVSNLDFDGRRTYQPTAEDVQGNGEWPISL